jgi:ribosomal protein S18 acetylase RimI-like enzyme
MTKEYLIRGAKPEDVYFIADAILSAEKGGTEKASLSTLFNLPDEKTKTLLYKVLSEEINGCELSLSSFLVADHNGIPVAATAGWIEEYEEGIPSGRIKSNLLNFIYPKENIKIALANASLINGLQLTREKNTLQIEYVFVSPEHRNKGLAGSLIRKHAANSLLAFPELEKAQVQVFKNNNPAIKLYERIGFRTTLVFKASDKTILDYLPSDEKLLMELILNKIV